LGAEAMLGKFWELPAFGGIANARQLI